MNYETILGVTETEIVISRSRFLTHLARVSDEEAAREVIANVRAAHPKARHHCTAFIIGPGEVKRSNDDGEPQGTAGAPMLETLEANGLGDVVAVVTRYFGGVLLGAAGLTRAYRSAVATAVEGATRVKRELLRELVAECSYEIAPIIEAEYRRRSQFVSADYGESVRITLTASPESAKKMISDIAELSAGKAIVTLMDTRYFDVIS